MNEFQNLVRSLSDVLGPSSGIDSDDVDPQQLIDCMNAYTSDTEKWEAFAFSDPGKAYTRNLVDEGNGKSNLLIVVWQPGKSTPIHDHANAHCVMKMLKGSLRETLYSYPSATPTPSASHPPSPSPSTRSATATATATRPHPPRPVRETTYSENETTYISDQIGLHKISNTSSTEVAVSLHLYTPPHAANFGFNIFEPTTGRCSHITSYTLYSKYGKPMERSMEAANIGTGARL